MFPLTARAASTVCVIFVLIRVSDLESRATVNPSGTPMDDAIDAEQVELPAGCAKMAQQEAWCAQDAADILDGLATMGNS